MRIVPPQVPESAGVAQAQSQPIRHRRVGSFGRLTLAELDVRLVVAGAQLGLEVRCHQSNHEGTQFEALHAARVGTRSDF